MGQCNQKQKERKEKEKSTPAKRHKGTACIKVLFSEKGVLDRLFKKDPQIFLCLPCFSQSKLRGGWVIWSVHPCGPLSLIDVGSISLPT
eukprot:1151038-Pelagomonas_calceolata.AAC.1